MQADRLFAESSKAPDGATVAAVLVARFADVFGHVPLAVLLVDGAGRIQRANAAATDLLGRTADSIAGIALDTLVAAEDRAALARDIALAQAGGRANTPVPRRYVDAGGAPLPVLEHLSVIGADGAGRTLLLVRLFDQTPAQAAPSPIEQNLRDNEARYRSLFEYHPDGVYSYDLDGRFTSVNDALTRLTGYTREALLGMNYAALIEPEQLPRSVENFYRAAAGQAVSYDTIAVRQDGTRIHVHVTKVPIVVDERVVGVYGIARDTTVLRAVEADLAVTLATLSDAFLMLDADGRFTYLNTEAERMLGRGREDMLGQRMSTALPELRGSRLDLGVRNALGQGGATSFEHWDAQRRLWIEGRIYPSARGIAMTLRDVTARKREAVALAVANRGLRMLSACNEALVRADDEQRLLDAICEIAVREGGYSLAWVGYAAKDGTHRVQPMAVHGAARSYVSTIDTRWDRDDPRGNGPVGRAIRGGLPVIVRNMLDDPTCRPWRSEAMAYGLRGALCLPLVSGGHTLGALLLYTLEPLLVSNDEVALLLKLANDLAYGITSLRLRADRQKKQAALFAIAQAMSMRMDTTRFPQISRAAVDALHADAAAVIEQPANPAAPPMREDLVFALRDGARRPWNDGEAARLYPLVTGAGSREDQARLIGQAELDAAGIETTDPDGGRLHACAVAPCSAAPGHARAWIVALFRAPIDDPDFVLAALRVLASRVGVEIARRADEITVRHQASLLDKAQDAILVRDEHNVITYWNKGSERLYGWTAEEALGRDIQTLLYDNPVDFLQAMALLHAHGEWTGELTQRTKTGRVITAECRWTLVRDDKTRAISVFAINTDITPRKTIERELMQLNATLESRVRQRTGELEIANRELEAFSSSVSHDLRAPLMVIDGFATMLLNAPEDRLGETERRHVERIRSRTLLMQELIEDLLSLSKVTRARLERREVDLAAISAQVIEDLRAVEPTREVEVRIDKPLRANCDATLIRQVLANLIGNAWKFSSKVAHARIEIGMRPDAGDQPVYFVADNGAGFDEAYADKLFKAFERLHSSSEFAGTGIGLAIVHRIVERHGGRVWAASAVGQGARFMFTLGP